MKPGPVGNGRLTQEQKTYAAPMQFRNHRLPAAIVLLSVSSTLGACSETTQQDLPTTTSKPDLGVEVVADEYLYLPTVLAIEGVDTVTVRNDGGLTHTWTVLAESVGTEAEIVPARILAEGRVEVGQKTTVDVRDLGPGRYQVVCAIPGHFSAGMEGELVIGGG